MGGRTMIEQLRALCADLDAGRAPRRLSWGRALAPLVVPVALALGTGCPAEPEPVEVYGAPSPGLVEPAPAPALPEPVEVYGAPSPGLVEPAPTTGPVVPEPVGVYGAPPSSAQEKPPAPPPSLGDAVPEYGAPSPGPPPGGATGPAVGTSPSRPVEMLPRPLYAAPLDPDGPAAAPGGGGVADPAPRPPRPSVEVPSIQNDGPVVRYGAPF